LRLITSSYFTGAMHRKVAGLLAPEDAIDIASHAAVLVDKISPIRDQPTAGHEGAVRVDRG
jgi:hypothetical protein